jgi:hypothetical protein
VSATVNVIAHGTTTVSGSVRTALETKAVARADQEIDRRIESLSSALMRIKAMQRVSGEGKVALESNVSAHIAALAALKEKISADTIPADLKTDIQSITKGYRVYALLLPQIHIIASADRAVTIADHMSALEAKLAMRIASSTGDMSALVTLDADLKTQIESANTQVAEAVAVVAVLEPDNGDAALMKSNTAALKDAQTKIKAATKALVAARADITAIIKGLRVNVGASATTSTSAETH